MSTGADPRFYVADVAVPPDRDCYIERAADTEILQSIREGEYTLLLSSRKVGKSSLLVRTLARLRAGLEAPNPVRFLTACQELSEAKPGLTEKEWYFGLINALVNDAKRTNAGFAIAADWEQWWQSEATVPCGQRFAEFLRRFFLEPTTECWVIAIDEIDTLLALPFSDDFFAAIRRCRNARATDPLFGRLVFVLAGVTTHARLIKDNRRTPFNFGRNVVLTDFSPDQAKIFLRGLNEPETADHPALLAVLAWTGGHPYLTQAAFKGLAKLRKKQNPTGPIDWPALVDQAVRETLIDTLETATPDPQLQDIAERRFHNLSVPESPNYNPALKRRMLTLYRHARRGRRVADEALLPPILELKICGLLVPSNADPGRLVVRNRLYRAVFDEAWIASEMPRDRAQIWAMAAMIAVLLGISGMLYLQNTKQQAIISQYRQDIQQADQDVPLVAYNKLKKIRGQSAKADELLAEYWRSKARIASVERPRDEAAVFWLQSLLLQENAEARLQSRWALWGNLASTEMCFRHPANVGSAAFSPDGRRVVTASDDNSARVWDVSSGQPLGAPLHHSASISSVTFSADGRRVVTASEDKTARVWDATTGQPYGHPLQHGGWVFSATFSPDGRRVATASADKTARVWDVANGQPIGLPLQHRDAVLSVAFSENGQQVVTASADKSARVWDAANGRPLGPPMKHSNVVNTAVFSRDGKRVVTASNDNKAHLWETGSGRTIGPLLQHRGWVATAMFSADGRRVVTASADGTARVWDVANGQPLGPPLQHSGSVSTAAFSKDGRLVVTASADQTARVWEVASGQPLGPPFQHADWVWSATLSEDGRRVVTASWDKTARVWGLASGQPLGRHLQMNNYINSVSFSADGRRLVTANDDQAARVWDAATGQPLALRFQHGDSVRTAAFSADGRRVVTASDDHTARVWDLASGQPIGPPLQHGGSVRAAAFSADGRRVVTASGDHTARVWDLASGRLVVPPLQHGGTVNSAAFSADGRRVVTASEDKTTRVWDAMSGQPVGPPLQHSRVVNSVALSGDGMRVLTANADGSARVWTAASSQPLGLPLQHSSVVYFATFSANGQKLVTRTNRGWHFWRLDEKGNYQPEYTIWSSGSLIYGPQDFCERDALHIKVVEVWTGNRLFVRDITLNDPEPGLPELVLPAAQLLTNYLRRFNLQFETNAAGVMRPNLIPRFPVSKPMERRENRPDVRVASPRTPIPTKNDIIASRR